MSSFLVWRRSESGQCSSGVSSDEISRIWENNVLLVHVLLVHFTLGQTLQKIPKAQRLQILQGILRRLSEKKCTSKFVLLFFGS